MLLGDSFLFAGQVPWTQSFVGQLETRIPNVDWLNAGVDGYNTSDASDALERVEGASGRGLAVLLLGQRHLGERLVQSTTDET